MRSCQLKRFIVIWNFRHFFVKFEFVKMIFGVIKLWIFDVAFTGVAPDAEVGKTDAHQMCFLQPMEQHVLIDVSTAVHLNII